MRFAAVVVPIVTAGLLASCPAAHVRPAAHPRAGTIGQRIDVHMMLGALPHSSRPAVLPPGAVTGTTQTYRADGTGQAVLSSDSRACLIFRHRQAWQTRQATTRTCPVATVTVVP